MINIQNQEGKNISLIVEQPVTDSRGLVFVMHGLGGHKYQRVIRMLAEGYLEFGYTVVRFDATNDAGESEGNYAEATVTNHLADLRAVIDWARTQEWFRTPFALAGHSMGGMCSLLYAEENPEEVEQLTLVATSISGKLSLETPMYYNIEEQKRRGWINEVKDIKLKWSHLEDRLKYDALGKADKLTMPVWLVVGDRDELTPPMHQWQLYKELPGERKLILVPEAEHYLREAKPLANIKEELLRWLRR